MTLRLLPLLLASAAAAYGQTPAPVTMAPIECRTQVDRSAVRVGEPLTFVLTCAVVDTQSTTVVLDESRLDPTVLQAPPFDVLGGTRAADVRTPTHRVIQYEYTLRFIGEQIGADLVLQGPALTYRVQTRVNGNPVDGRERQYLLPAHRIRIVSQVPATATGVHDPLPESLSVLDRRRFTVRMIRVAGWCLIALGGVLGVWALVAASAPRRARTRRASAPLISERAVLREASRVVARVQRTRRTEPWSDRLAADALPPLRIAAAYSGGRPVTQVPAAGREPVAGQIRIASSWLRRRGTLASAAAGLVTSPPGVAPDPAHRHDGELQTAIATLSSAAYGRAGATEVTELDQALDAGATAIRRAARRFTRRARARRLVAQVAARVRGTTWER